MLFSDCSASSAYSLGSSSDGAVGKRCYALRCVLLYVTRLLGERQKDGYYTCSETRQQTKALRVMHKNESVRCAVGSHANQRRTLGIQSSPGLSVSVSSHARPHMPIMPTAYVSHAIQRMPLLIASSLVSSAILSPHSVRALTRTRRKTWSASKRRS